MIRSKTPRVIDAQSGREEIIYLDNASVNRLKHKQVVEVTVVSGYKAKDTIVKRRVNIDGLDQMVDFNVKGKFVPTSQKTGVFKTATFDVLFAGLNQANEDQHLIDQIDFVNKHVWPVGTAEESKIKFWDFTAADLEIVPVEAPTVEK